MFTVVVLFRLIPLTFKRVREVGCFHMWLFSRSTWIPPFFHPSALFLSCPTAVQPCKSIWARFRPQNLRGNAGSAKRSRRNTVRWALGWARRHDSTGWVMGSGMRGEASSGLRTPATEMRPLAMRHPPKHRAHPQRPPSMVPPSRARATGSRVPVAPRRRSLPLALRQAPSRCQLQPSLERPSTHSRAAGDST